ncbi:MAG: tetratricopeptide repeat protein [Nitrospiria bacterium]
MKIVLMASFFIGVWQGLFPSLSHAKDQDPDAVSSLQALKIAAAKRDLRRSEIRPEGALASLIPSIEEDYKANRFDAVIEAVRAIPDEEKPVELHLMHGNALFLLGRSEAAVGAYQQAFRMAALPREKAAALANFGFILLNKGRWQDAASWLERALQIDRSINDWASQGRALSGLGIAYLQSGDTEKGVEAHIEALEIAETVPIDWLQARQLKILGNLYYLDGILHLAQDHYQKAIRIYRRLGDPLGEAAVLNGLGFVYKDRKDFDQAIDHQKRALSIYRRVNDAEKVTKGLVNLSLTYRDQGAFNAALDLGEQVLSIQTKNGNRYGMAEIEGTIGTIYEQKGDLGEALRRLERARSHFQAAGATQQIHIVELRIQALEDRLQ